MKTLRLIMSILFVSVGLLLTAAVISTTGLNPVLSVGVAVGLGFTMDQVKKYTDFGFSFATVCGEISANMEKSCTNPLQAGTRDRAIVLNFADIVSISYNSTNLQTVEDIVLATGATGFYIDGKNNSIRPMAALVPGTFDNMFDHTVQMIGFDISPAAKEQFNSMKNGRFVVITENYYRGTSGNSAFEVYGLTTGLELTALTKDPNSQDTQGAFDFTLSTKTNKEPNLPNSFFVTSYSATKAIVDALL